VTVYVTILVLSLAVQWAAIGRSAGKHVMGLRLLTTRGDRVRGLVAAGRAIVCVAFPIGLFWLAVDAHGRSLHDLLFGTTVVYDWSRRVPPPVHPTPVS
jgi:uncharacterized RDD family membrane protein YckC